MKLNEPIDFEYTLGDETIRLVTTQGELLEVMIDALALSLGLKYDSDFPERFLEEIEALGRVAHVADDFPSKYHEKFLIALKAKKALLEESSTDEALVAYAKDTNNIENAIRTECCGSFIIQTENASTDFACLACGDAVTSEGKEADA